MALRMGARMTATVRLLDRLRLEAPNADIIRYIAYTASPLSGQHVLPLGICWKSFPNDPEPPNIGDVVRFSGTLIPGAANLPAEVWADMMAFANPEITHAFGPGSDATIHVVGRVHSKTEGGGGRLLVELWQNGRRYMVGCV